MIKHISTATSGTVTLPDTKEDCFFSHNAGSLAATLTLTLPASPKDGQILIVSTDLGVTALTMNGGTILNALTTLLAGGFGQWIYESSSSKWRRVA